MPVCQCFLCCSGLIVMQPGQIKWDASSLHCNKALHTKHSVFTHWPRSMASQHSWELMTGTNTPGDNSIDVEEAAEGGGLRDFLHVEEGRLGGDDERGILWEWASEPRRESGCSVKTLDEESWRWTLEGGGFVLDLSLQEFEEEDQRSCIIFSCGGSGCCDWSMNASFTIVQNTKWLGSIDSSLTYSVIEKCANCEWWFWLSSLCFVLVCVASAVCGVWFASCQLPSNE